MIDRPRINSFDSNAEKAVSSSILFQSQSGIQQPLWGLTRCSFVHPVRGPLPDLQGQH